MNISDRELYNPSFSHIYIEKDLINDGRVRDILAKFPAASVIIIDHYKDLFCRSSQDYMRQHRSQALILAKRRKPEIYEGSRVCQSFDNAHFYYSSDVMNCIYDCDYCFLKGMYPSANMVVFVNIEDTFEEAAKLLAKHSVYLSVSYETDLAAVEPLFGMVRKWNDFVIEVNERSDNKLTVEVRTKNANYRVWDELKVSENMIYAFTLSPNEVIKSCEHKTPLLKDRLCCIDHLLQKGFKVRLCFDPMIYCHGWKTEYGNMLKEIRDRIDLSRITDMSIGSFRISRDYYKKMRKAAPYSTITHFPYENEDGFYHYPKEIMDELEGFLYSELGMIYPQDKIYLWKE